MLLVRSTCTCQARLADHLLWPLGAPPVLPTGNYTLGGIAWGQGWCRWYSLEVAEGSTPLIPWSAGNTINEAESLAASVIIEALASLVGQTDVLLFIDNEVGPGT